MERHAVDPGARVRGARLLGVTALALAGLAPAWLAGPAPAAAVTHPTGGVVAWGDGSAGQTNVPADAHSGVISVAAGCAHSLALRSDGRVVAWGDNTYGQTDVPDAAKAGVAGIVAGCNHSLALKSNGTIVAWGDRSFGQTSVPSIPSGWKWTNIAAGTSHSVGIARSRYAADVYVWGDNSQGQADVPPSEWDSIQSVDWHDILDVEAGGNATIARTRGGTVFVWGPHFIAVMGGAAPPSVTDVPKGLSGVVGMSMGQFHALVVRSNGTVAAWGDISSGQLKVVRSLSKVKAVAAGGNHSLALKSNGTIVGWGANDLGQASQPPRAGSRFLWVAAGLNHSLAVGQLTPDAPKGVTVTPWDGVLSVSWAAPDDPGYTPIVAYTVTAAPGGKTCTTDGALACSIDGLDIGTSYTLTVTARNSIGIGTPATTLPVAAAVPVPPTPEPTASPSPSPTPSATPSPADDEGGAGGAGGAGGLPMPVLIAIAALVGIGVAAVAYKPSLLVEQARELVARLRHKPSPPPAEAAAAALEPTDPPEFTPPQKR